MRRCCASPARTCRCPMRPISSSSPCLRSPRWSRPPSPSATADLLSPTMPVNILMPALSPTMEKGNLSKWLKHEGDKVKAGEVIAEIETDKATMEYESIDDGV